MFFQNPNQILSIKLLYILQPTPNTVVYYAIVCSSTFILIFFLFFIWLSLYTANQGILFKINLKMKCCPYCVLPIENKKNAKQKTENLKSTPQHQYSIEMVTRIAYCVSRPMLQSIPLSSLKACRLSSTPHNYSSIIFLLFRPRKKLGRKKEKLSSIST